jgi:hypothetical protein
MWHVRERRELHTGFYVKKTEGKRLLVRSRSRWENNIEIYVRDIGRMGVE